MPITLRFTPQLARFLECPKHEVEGASVREVFDAYFQNNPLSRGYVLDDQGAVRKHVAVFVNRELVRDRLRLSDPVRDGDDVFVVQALSGG